MYNNITDVAGITVGHAVDKQGVTGCTVIVAKEGAVCGVDVRGSAPGTRETDALDPINGVEKVHAILLAGGSAFGLEAASGVMKYLAEQQIGLFVEVATVPIVPGAVIFDLLIGSPTAYATKEMGYEATQNAIVGPFDNGNVGVGYGATVGKVAGIEHFMKGGLGSYSIQGMEDLVVGAIVAVNAVGDVREPGTKEIIAGSRNHTTGEWLDSCALIKQYASIQTTPGANTTIGTIAINAKLTKSEAKKLAQLTQNALAHTIYPVHTMFDGDTIFVLGTGEKQYQLDYLGQLAIEAMEQAIVLAVKDAKRLANVECYESIQK
ncbi:P1 family peptidase [Solibacillus sp. FSL W7-1472]|uniref:P1 family peptidase n=1 Tax=Solibacillus sp. FSL W7-1472 TaxID=2921707 RepID=UPI0030DCDAF1